MEATTYAWVDGVRLRNAVLTGLDLALLAGMLTCPMKRGQKEPSLGQEVCAPAGLDHLFDHSKGLVDSPASVLRWRTLKERVSHVRIEESHRFSQALGQDAQRPL